MIKSQAIIISILILNPIIVLVCTSSDSRSSGPRANDGFSDDFETYLTGTFPNTWIPDANARDLTTNHITNTISFSENKSLLLYGVTGASWAAIAYHPLNTTSAYTIEIALRNGNEALSGDHPDRGSIGIRQGTSWMNPHRFLVYYRGNNTIWSANGTYMGDYIPLTWYHWIITYERLPGTLVRINYWLDGIHKLNETIPAISTEDQFDNLEISAQEGSAWFDSVAISSLSTECNISAFNPTGINVALNSTINIRFNKAMNATSAQNSFEIIPNISTIAYTWSNDRKVLSIAHGDFTENTTYYVTIQSGAKSITNLSINYTIRWQFTTFLLPRVNGYSPTGNNTPLDSPILISFNVPMNMLSVQNSINSTPPLSSAYSWSLDRTILTIAPQDLTENTTYSISVLAGALSEVNAPLKETVSWQFKTQILPHIISFKPEGDNVALNEPFIILFDAPMNTASVMSSLSIRPIISVSFSWSLDNRKLIMDHMTEFNDGTTYNVTIKSGALSANDTPLARSLSWEFNTYLLPKTVGYSPRGENVPLDAPLELSFNVPMDEQSLQKHLKITPVIALNYRWSQDRTNVTVGHGDFLDNTIYNISIDAGVKSIMNAPMRNSISWEFKTIIFPTVTSCSAEGNDTLLNTSIKITFNVPMNGESVNDQITIEPELPLTFHWSTDNRTVTIDHVQFKENETYFLVVRAGIQSNAGSIMKADFSRQFRTILLPGFTSYPFTYGTVGIEYKYTAVASGTDDALLRYYLVEKPDEMVIDEYTGEVAWIPKVAGKATVILKVTDNFGNIALQEFIINVKDWIRPDIKLIIPFEGQRVKGTLNISGIIIMGTSNRTVVQVSVGSADWINATGAPNWYYILDTTNILNGWHTIYLRTFDGHYYSGVVQRNITVNNPKAPNNNVVRQNNLTLPVVGVTLMAIIIIALAFGATEPGKYGFFAFTAPLYTRIKKEDALDHEIRYKIMGYLTDNPGEHYSALKKALNLENGGMVYHLLVLERDGFIKSQRDGILKRFYPATVRAPETRNRTPEELETDIIQAVAERPGTTQRELVDRLVVSDKVVGNHLRKLVRESKITSTKNGKTRVYFPPGRT